MSNAPYSLPVGLKNAQSDQSQINFIGVFKSYFKFWPYFVISILVCLVAGYVYLKSDTPIFTVQAKILINDENVGPSVKMEGQQLSAVKKVEDEIEILRSRTIMEKVVRDLDLAISYYTMADFKPIDVYGSTPVRLIINEPRKDHSTQFLEIVIHDKKSFSLKQARSETVYSFGESLKSTWGSWKLIPTKNIETYIGQTIRIYIEDPNAVTGSYLSSFNAEMQTQQSAIVLLSMYETVPERGADVINGVIRAYNMASIDYKNKVNQSTLNFLNDRLNAITAELNNIEKRIETYKSSRGITNLSAESQVYLDNVKSNDSRLNDVNVQLEIIHEIQKYINSPVSDGNAPAITGISDPGLVSLIDQLIKLETQRERLLSNTPEKNPLFVPINRQISITKNAIRENIKGIKRSLLATRNQLRGFNKTFEHSIKKLPGQEREYINIKRQQSIKEELYIFLLQKREEAGMNNASKLLDSRIVDQAHFGYPETHNANFTYTLALIFGLVFPAGVIFARQLLNNKVITASEIEAMVQVPMIGELSYQKSMPTMLDASGSRTMMAEQFRTLRTKLSHINGRNGYGKVTMLTSGIPGEGKSMICRNLAAVMAAAGRKTVIVDADLRKPQLANSLQLTGHLGLSDYLDGKAFKEQIVQPSNFHPELFVISAGTINENPSEMLERPAMDDLIVWLRQHFDEILVDTPPVELVTDALILTKYSDSTLFILRQNYTLKSQLRSINQLNYDGSLNNLHLVFNGVIAGEGLAYSKKYGAQYYTGDQNKMSFSIFRAN
jgi:capsular exopolysaccharide synthesis family protein